MLLRTVCTQNVVRGRIFNLNQVSFLRFTHNKGRVEAAKDAVRQRLLPARRFRITMSEEERMTKMKKIEEANMEKPPEGLFPKVKFYFKRYWYIAVPVHMVVCSVWFGIFYAAVKSGVDVIHVLEVLHIPDSIVNKVKNTSPSAGYIVMALLLYKIATPIRYACSLVGIQVAFVVLRKLDLLKTAREVEYHFRTRYAQLNRRRVSAASQQRLRPQKKSEEKK